MTMNEPLRQAVERVCGQIKRHEALAMTGEQTDDMRGARHERQKAADLRTILAALAHPLLGGDLGSDPEDLSRSASGEREEARVGHWRCTRCGQNEITARANGCTRGPCPMEPV